MSLLSDFAAACAAALLFLAILEVLVVRELAKTVGGDGALSMVLVLFSRLGSCTMELCPGTDYGFSDIRRLYCQASIADSAGVLKQEKARIM